ncbi:hypothetical protein [Actinoplanes regularis]|uniref:Sporulation and spore germination n=1 Tax=Actinoplanes regularis TaxID=52697 RepID=A0A239E6X7_9ACTN|nr:hypothetical protein [Actinoplanes regularis]GIE89311.1 hypothetical protein Are01nite_57910 [Actinoplanes regularis]SNS39634.1 hypothetical protein SAMN06264365_1153 [Actinoplanes regularis]
MSRFLLSAAVLLAGLTGTAAPAVAAEPAAPSAQTSPVVTRQAVAVALVRTGGGSGQAVTTLVGANTREDAAVLRLASSAAFLALRPSYTIARVPANRFTYRIEAGYRDRTTKRVIVVQGAPGTPQVALDVIRMMTNVRGMNLDNVRLNFGPGFPFN